MSQITVLHLDRGTNWIERALQPEIDAGVTVNITTLERGEVFSDQMASYIVSGRGVNLARTATPDKYDLVVIGNNLHTGVVYAEYIPEETREKTLVVWNDYEPGDEHYYARLGFTHFCSRPDQPTYIPTMLSLARQ